MRRKLFYRIIVLFIASFLLLSHSGHKKNSFQAEDATANMKEEAMPQAAKRSVKSKPAKYCIDITGLSQDGYPTGCESVSAVVLLQYYQIPVSISSFIEEYLPTEPFYFENGMLCGPDPHLAFAGDPYDCSSLGCYAEVITKSLNLVLEERDTGKQAKTLKNVPLSELEETYLSCDIPVAIWVTMEMKASTDGTTYLLENGNSFTWISGEHCMVLTGYDESRYYLLDPLADGTLVSYPKSLVEMRYQELGMQAVVIETVS